MRSKILALSLIFLISFGLVACGRSTSDDNPVLGEINYNAQIAYLDLMDTDQGLMLEYREVLDLDRFIGESDVPVVLIVRQPQDYNASRVIPEVEQAASEYGDKVNFVFAYDSQEIDFLRLLDYTVTPTFFLIDDYMVQAQASWEQEEGMQILYQKLNELIAQN